MIDELKIMTIVDRLHGDFHSLISYLDNAHEPSFRSTADESFRKSLLLAAASYFEDRVTACIVSFVHNHSQQNELLVSFVKEKALNRQYHTLFDWDRNNANKFFSLFGTSFKSFMQGELRKEPNLDKSVQAFLEIGRERNRLVHQNYASYSIEKTAEEIYELYKSALMFVELLSAHLSTCSREIRDSTSVEA
jgi:hypothetical protein